MAAGNNAFTLQGSTPYGPQKPSNPFSLGGKSPYSVALNSAQGNGFNTSTPPLGGSLAPSASTPLKKTTTNNVDGSSVTHEYHAPAAPGSPEAAASQQAADLQRLYPGLIPGGTTPGQDTRPGMGGITSGYIPSATPNYAAGQGYAPNGAPTPTTGGQLGQSVSGLIGLGSGSGANAENAYTNLANLAGSNVALGQNAQDIARRAGEDIARVGQTGAKGQAGYVTTGTSPVGEGNAAVLGQTTAKQQQAIAEGAAQALEGNQQAIAATGQGQTGYNEAGNLALAGRGQNITALGSAGNLSQPVSQFGVLGTPQSVGPFGSNTGAAAFQGGYIGGQQAAGQTAAQMTVANTAAKGIEGTIQQYLQTNPQLNVSTSTIANAAQQWLQGKQLGDPAYQTLFNYLNEYISTLAPILGVGGDTTNLKTEIAQSFVNAKASGQSIAQVLQNIGKLADQKLQNIISAGQGGGQVAGGVPTGTTPTSFGTEW